MLGLMDSMVLKETRDLKERLGSRVRSVLKELLVSMVVMERTVLTATRVTRECRATKDPREGLVWLERMEPMVLTVLMVLTD